MMSSTLQQAFNKQIKEELASAYIYLSMAAYLDYEGYGGMASWMKKQAAEERDHAMRFYGHLMERGCRVKFEALPEPPATWASPVDVFARALEHERHITGCIHALVAQAEEEKDYAAREFLQWFVCEQVEEESTVEAILQKMQRIGDSPTGLYLLDRELGNRTH